MIDWIPIVGEGSLLAQSAAVLLIGSLVLGGVYTHNTLAERSGRAQVDGPLAEVVNSIVSVALFVVAISAVIVLGHIVVIVATLLLSGIIGTVILGILIAVLVFGLPIFALMASPV